MPGRNLALGGAFAIVALLTFLTVAVIVEDGIDVLTIVSLVILLVIGVGVFGALSNPPDDR
jgi:hypothetical protein